MNFTSTGQYGGCEHAHAERRGPILRRSKLAGAMKSRTTMQDATDFYRLLADGGAAFIKRQ
jgi:hypothetical protein